jgi:hypothetical protein
MWATILKGEKNNTAEIKQKMKADRNIEEEKERRMYKKMREDK